MEHAESGLVVEGLSKAYSGTWALSGVSLGIGAGEVVALVGHNGAGKSTLLRSLSGAERPDAGEIRIDGAVQSFGSPSDAAAAGIACVYQELSLVDQLTVAQNMFLGREAVSGGRLRHAEMTERTADLCRRFGIQAQPGDRVGTLPVAQRQMIEVARAVDRGSRFLLLDEPTTALEQTQIEHLLKTIRQLAADGLGVMLVDHKLDEVFAVADRIFGLANGRIVLDGPVTEVDRAAVVEAVVGHDAAEEVADVVFEEERPEEDVETATRTLGDVVFRAEHVSGPRLEDVTLEVRAGQVLGVYGLVGSGRTRFLRTVYGAEPLAGGTMTLDGAGYQPSRPRQAIRKGIALVSEERKHDGILPLMSGKDNVVLPVLDRFRRLGILNWKALHGSADEVLSMIDVRGDVNGPIGSLSGGNQQKVLFARATLQAPRLLLLDEPTKGVDIGAKSEIYSIIQRLAREKNVAIIVVSTEEEELMVAADDIAVFRSGVCTGETIPASTATPVLLRQLAWADAEEQAAS